MADKNFKVKTGLTLPSPLPVDQGGTGQTTTTNTLNALLPDQTNSANKILSTNGTNVLWIDGLSLSASNSFTNNQIIDTSTSVAALRITQRGTGEALRVEDETNPDSSPFVIDTSGNVGIGAPSPTYRIQTISSLASSVGSQALVYQNQVDNGNADYLKIYQERTVATPSWSGSDWIIRRHVDSTPMGGLKWSAGDPNITAIYGNSTTPSIRTIHISTSAPSGGNDGDVWAVYTP